MVYKVKNNFKYNKGKGFNKIQVKGLNPTNVQAGLDKVMTYKEWEELLNTTQFKDMGIVF